jgi:hypothetical protein
VNRCAPLYAVITSGRRRPFGATSKPCWMAQARIWAVDGSAASSALRWGACERVARVPHPVELEDRQVAAQVAVGGQVDRSAEQLLQLQFDASDGEHARNVVGFDLDQEIDVACWSGVPTEHGAEGSQSSNRVTMGECTKNLVLHPDPWSQLTGPSSDEAERRWEVGMTPGSNPTNLVRSWWDPQR